MILLMAAVLNLECQRNCKNSLTLAVQTQVIWHQKEFFNSRVDGASPNIEGPRLQRRWRVPVNGRCMWLAGETPAATVDDI